MQAIEAVWKHGVFTPEGSVDLEEGAKVLLQLKEEDVVECEGSDDTVKPVKRPGPSPSPFLLDEAIPAPFDLPMPKGTPVTAVSAPMPLPDPHDTDD
ncbi:MAG: antitoxin family protein [Planctomycetota bacterium]|nr:antitoxin family protein [Planctomycetota bacterium]